MKKVLFIICLFISARSFSQSVSTPLNAVAIDSSGTPISYQWTKVSGPNSMSFSSTTTANTTATFTATGTYLISCTATNGLGSTSSATVTAVVVPKLSITITPNAVKLTLQ